MNKGRLKLFFWYILTEPARQMWDWIKKMALGQSFYHPKAWVYIFIVVFITSLIEGTKIFQIISLAILLIMMLLKEYETGKFIEAHRRKYGRFYKSDYKKNKKFK